MRVTGKVESKRYRCTDCGHETSTSTNHYGEYYARCPKCSWKSPMDSTKTFECLEPLPEGWAKPTPWKKMQLQELVQLKPIT